MNFICTFSAHDINKIKHNNRNSLILMNCVDLLTSTGFLLLVRPVRPVRLNTSRPEDASFETIRDAACVMPDHKALCAAHMYGLL